MPHRELNTDRARTLRQESTPPEQILWTQLRGRRLDGLKFRRQQPIGPYTADFYSAAAKLVVEIDSRIHDRHHDTRRDAWMLAEGIHTLRVTAGDIRTNLDGVLATIIRISRERMKEG